MGLMDKFKKKIQEMQLKSLEQQEASTKKALNKQAQKTGFFSDLQNKALQSQLDKQQELKKQLSTNDSKETPTSSNHAPRNVFSPFEKELARIKYELTHRYSEAEMNDYFARNDGQIPAYNESGTAVILWWLNNNDPVTDYIPSYFYFQYGMNFVDEVKKMNVNGLLKEFSLTDAGKQYLSDHMEDVDNHRDPDGSKRAAQQNASVYEPAGDIDFSKVKFVDFDRLSNRKFEKGLSLLNISKELCKQKEYEKALHASYEAMMIGYLAPAIFERAAIIARGMKDYNLEKEILVLADKMTEQQFIRDFGRTNAYSRPDWIQKRMTRVENLLNKRQ